MARISRIVIPGHPHHVVQRGVRSMDVFFSDEDRVVYLNLLRVMGKRYGLSFWAWCLMTNHVHLVAVPAHEDSLARALGEAHRRYTCRVNFRSNVRGHLFQERFYSYPIQFDGHFLSAVRYIELNPVRAGIVNSCEEYRWSSARYHLAGEKDRLVESSPTLSLAPDWRSFLHDGLENARMNDEIELHLRTGRPLGTGEWLDQLEATTARHLAPRKGGRPRKSPDL